MNTRQAIAATALTLMAGWAGLSATAHAAPTHEEMNLWTGEVVHTDHDLGSDWDTDPAAYGR